MSEGGREHDGRVNLAARSWRGLIILRETGRQKAGFCKSVARKKHTEQMTADALGGRRTDGSVLPSPSPPMREWPVPVPFSRADY